MQSVALLGLHFDRLKPDQDYMVTGRLLLRGLLEGQADMTLTATCSLPAQEPKTREEWEAWFLLELQARLQAA